MTATLRALMEFYGVDIPIEMLPNLVLSVETKEVGIAAGLQDRVAQTYEGLVFMDFDRELMERQGHGCYEPMDPSLLPPLFVAYRTDLSEISGVVHSNYRARWEAGDPLLVVGMKRLAQIALEGKSCLLARDWARLGELIDENFDTRAHMTKLDPRNVEMVMLARRLGAPAHYAGSGGSILGMYRDDEHFEVLRESFASLGCNLIKPRIS